jgi:hypothetical protein
MAEFAERKEVAPHPLFFLYKMKLDSANLSQGRAERPWFRQNSRKVRNTDKYWLSVVCAIDPNNTSGKSLKIEP